MSKGHRDTGNYVGFTGSYAAGGVFSLKSAQLLKSAGAWGGLPGNGLQLHLDASTYPGSGTLWSDQSGNARHFSWTSTPSFTTGTVPYFNMNGYGANGPASNSYGINNTSGYTIFVAFYNNSLTYNGAFKFVGSPSRGIFSHLPWISGTIYLDQGGCCSVNQRVEVAMSNSTGAWNVIAFRCNPATERSIWQNGTKLIANTNAAADINLTADAVRLNSDSEYGTAWDAKLSQFVVYNRALTDAEMGTATAFLKKKVGLT